MGPASNLHLVAVLRREQGPQGPVDEPRGENFLGGRAAFALDEPAGEFARGVHLFTVVDREREEIEPFAPGGGDGGDEGKRFAEANDDRAGGLLGQPASLERDDFAADVPFDGDGFLDCGRAGHSTYLGRRGEEGVCSGEAGKTKRWIRL